MAAKKITELLEAEITSLINEHLEGFEMDLRNKVPFFMNYANGYMDTVSGVSPLSLPKAKANGLGYVKLFGGTELLPETYIDSVTAEGKCVQRNLPEGHQQVEYLVCDGGQWIETGYYPNNNTSVKTEIYITSSPSSIFGSCWSPIPTYDTFAAITGSTGNLVCYYGTYSSSEYITIQDISIDTKHTLEMNLNSVVFDSTSYPITRGTFTSTYEMYIGALNNNGTASENSKIKGRIYPLEVRENGVVIHNYIPDRYNNVLGMYDTVTGAFLTNAGTGSFTAGADVTTPTPSNPIYIWCNNGIIKYSANIFDQSLFNTYTSNDIVFTTFENIPNGTYTMSTNFPIVGTYANVFFMEGRKTTGATSATNGVTDTTPRTITVTDGMYTVAYRSTSSNTNDPKDFNWQIEAGSVISKYRPYPAGFYASDTVETIADNVGNTATCQRLCAITTYKDTQEVLSGAITRNVGIRILNGTEDTDVLSTYAYGTNSFSVRGNPISGAVSSSDVLTYCTHFNSVSFDDRTGAGNNICYIDSPSSTSPTRNIVLRNTGFETLGDFKTFLQNEYVKGTPFMLMFPLGDTSTTETVSGQLLTKAPVTYSGSIAGLTGTVVTSSHTTPTPTNPLDINCNNGVVKVSPNLFDKNGSTYGYYIDSNGVPQPSTYANFTFAYTDYIPVKPNTTYTLAATSVITALSNHRIFGYDENKNFLEQESNLVLPTNTVGVRGSQAFTTSADTKFLRINYLYIPDGENQQLELGATATPYHPYGQIYVDGTQETVEITGKNLFDISAFNANLRTGYIKNDSGAEIADGGTSGSSYSIYFIKVLPSTTYTISQNNTTSSISGYGQRIYFYDINKGWISRTSIDTISNRGAFTTPNNCYYIQIQSLTSALGNTDVQIELGSTATAYEPYFDGGTATAEMLLKVGAYKDEQSVIDGAVTRNLGIKVLDGSEEWIKGTTSFYADDLVNNSANNNLFIPYCTHYNGIVGSSTASEQVNTNNIRIYYSDSIGKRINIFAILNDYATAQDFANYLAQQYAQGNPVIIVYPLAESTTETVTGQTLNVKNGTNYATITQASMDNLELEVKYKKTK